MQEVLECIWVVTFQSIKMMCRGHALAIVQHQPTYLIINVGKRRAVFRAQLRQLQ